MFARFLLTFCSRSAHVLLTLAAQLLQHGADPNAATIGGFTPLHYCIGRDAAQTLLAGGADPAQSGQGVCHAIGGQRGIYEQAGPGKPLRNPPVAPVNGLF